jgi:hypothetical protein
MALPVSKVILREVETIIRHGISAKKAPGYDLITGKILKEMTDKGLQA